MDINLKLCPFCGGEAEIASCKSGGVIFRTTYYYVRCTTCGATSRVQEVARKAERSWNRRADDETD
jgi:Lar family restriction alleviation protein